MKDIIFFSVYRNKSTDSVNHRKVFRQLRSLKPTETKGCYMGIVEKSMFLPIVHLDLIERVARSYKQDSILIVDSSGIASLKYSTGKVDVLGTMVQVDKAEALTKDGYSLINGKYWVVK